jgi:hypothetical protein
MSFKRLVVLFTNTLTLQSHSRPFQESENPTRNLFLSSNQKLPGETSSPCTLRASEESLTVLRQSEKPERDLILSRNRKILRKTSSLPTRKWLRELPHTYFPLHPSM